MNLDSALLHQGVERLMVMARPGAAEVSGAWSLPDLIKQLAGRGMAAIRGKVLLLGVHGGEMGFVEPSVSIAGRSHLRMGRGCVLERGAHIRAFGSGGLTLGDGVTIGRYSIIEVSSGIASAEGEIRLGDGVGISDHCFLGGAGGLYVGANTIVGQGASFHPENHSLGNGGPVKANPLSHKGIHIGSGCWIGAGARVLDGVTIGDNTTIGAGSVVTHSIPANEVAYGVPAKVR